jgi:predicted ArsR family transcriptional regulator
MTRTPSKPTTPNSSAIRAPARHRNKPPATKRAQIIGLLQRRRGASLVELTEATGWQAHSIRAALTGLRKQNVRVDRSRDKQGGSVYRIVTEASS